MAIKLDSVVSSTTSSSKLRRRDWKAPLPGGFGEMQWHLPKPLHGALILGIAAIGSSRSWWFNHLLAHSDSPLRRGLDEVVITCPDSIFANVEPHAGQIILVILSVVASLPLMGTGLFFAFFGANVRTVLVAMQAFAMVGIPLLLPTISEMQSSMTSMDEFTPVMFTTLAAGGISANNAMTVILKAPARTKTQLVGFNTGLLLSGFFMGFWLPSVANAGLSPEHYNWILLGGAMAPGLAMTTIATKKEFEDPLASLSFALIGSFMFIGPVNGWIGGGNISLLSLASGTMGACATGGWVTMSILGLLIMGSMFVSLKKVQFNQDLCFFYFFHCGCP